MIKLPFPSLKAAERLAVLSFVVATFVMCATLGLRTAFFLPDHFVETEQLQWLTYQAVFDVVSACCVGVLVVWLRRPLLAKAILVTAALLIGLVKSFVASFLVSFAGEVNPWYTSPGTMLVCAFVNVPLWIAFFPVLNAVSKARGPRPEKASYETFDKPPPPPAPLDSPLDVRAATVTYLATVGIGSFLLGPDLLVRLCGGLACAFATAYFAVSLADEGRLVKWARQVASGADASLVAKEEAGPPSVPVLFAGTAPQVVLYTVSESAGSYRKGPEKAPVCALDPAGLKSRKGFGSRVGGRFFLALVPTILAVLLVLPMLEWVEVPPRAVTREYPHHEINRDTITKIEGLVLFNVQQPGNGRRLVGYDEDKREVVSGEPLFQRVHAPITEMADLANRILYDGRFPVLRDGEAGLARDRNPDVSPPRYENGYLIFWRDVNGVLTRDQVACSPPVVKPGTTSTASEKSTTTPPETPTSTARTSARPFVP